MRVGEIAKSDYWLHMSVRLSVCMEQLGFYWMDFYDV